MYKILISALRAIGSFEWALTVQLFVYFCCEGIPFDLITNALDVFQNFYKTKLKDFYLKIFIIPKPETAMVSAALSDKIVFFFVGFIVALVIIGLALLCKQTTSKKRESSYSPTRITLTNLKSSVEEKEGSVNNSSEQIEDGKTCDEQQKSEVFEDENSKQKSTGYVRLSQTDNKESGASGYKVNLVHDNKEYQNDLGENLGNIYQQEGNLQRSTAEENKTSDSSAPQLPPKTTRFSKNNTNSNNSNNLVHFPTESMLFLNHQLERPPPIQPKMGIHRFNSFRSDGKNVRTKPKLPPKPVFRSKSFQGQKVLPISKTVIDKDILTDNEQKVSLIE